MKGLTQPHGHRVHLGKLVARRVEVAERDQPGDAPLHRLGLQLGRTKLLGDLARLREQLERGLDRSVPARPVRSHEHRREAGTVVEPPREWGQKLPTMHSTMHSTMHLYPIDGAVHDVATQDTAFSYRDARWAEVIFGVDPDPAGADAIRDWCIAFHDATHAHSAGGAYVNFMMDEGQDRVRATYRGNYDRLADVKARYDPDNVFRVNQNIEPAAAAATES